MDLSHLGRSSQLPASPEEAKLDYVPNPRPGHPYLVRFTAPEFTSLCPVVGQPDFAHLIIDYAPAEIVESKSFKLKQRIKILHSASIRLRTGSGVAVCAAQQPHRLI